jgi:hypothetical protein
MNQGTLIYVVAKSEQRASIIAAKVTPPGFAIRYKRLMEPENFRGLPLGSMIYIEGDYNVPYGIVEQLSLRNLPYTFIPE